MKNFIASIIMMIMLSSSLQAYNHNLITRPVIKYQSIFHKTNKNYKINNKFSFANYSFNKSNYIYSKSIFFLNKLEENKKDKIDWQSPNLPHSILKKHNTGIGLTIAGSLFTAVGTILMVSSSNKSNTRTSGANVSFRGAPAFGLLLDFVGVPMLIAGLVKIGKANNLARYHLRTGNITE